MDNLSFLPICGDGKTDQDVPKDPRDDEEYKNRENPVVRLRVGTRLHRGAAQTALPTLIHFIPEFSHLTDLEVDDIANLLPES